VNIGTIHVQSIKLVSDTCVSRRCRLSKKLSQNILFL